MDFYGVLVDVKKQWCNNVLKLIAFFFFFCSFLFVLVINSTLFEALVNAVTFSMASHQNSVAQGETCDHNNLKLFLIHISRGVLLPASSFFLFFFFYSSTLSTTRAIFWTNVWISGFSIAHNPPTSTFDSPFSVGYSLAFIVRNSEKWNTYATETLCRMGVAGGVGGHLVCDRLWFASVSSIEPSRRQTRCPSAAEQVGCSAPHPAAP